MVTCYTGTPGSGKSLHTARAIFRMLNSGCRVICNFPVNMNCIKPKWRKNFYYLPDKELTPHYLFEFARAFHNKKAENQTYIFIDEAQRIFPIDRVYPKRKEWEQFIQLHRHMGYSVVIVTQNMSYINKGIRIQAEYEIKHRKVNNYGIGGLLLSMLHITLFASITYWQGTKERVSSEFFTYKRKWGMLYDTFSNFDTIFNNNAKAPAEDPKVGDKKTDEVKVDPVADQNLCDEISQGNFSQAGPFSVSENVENTALSEDKRKLLLDSFFGKIPEEEDDEEDKEELDVDSADFDEENIESWADDFYISPKELERWKSA